MEPNQQVEAETELEVGANLLGQSPGQKDWVVDG